MSKAAEAGKPYIQVNMVLVITKNEVLPVFFEWKLFYFGRECNCAIGWCFGI